MAFLRSFGLLATKSLIKPNAIQFIQHSRLFASDTDILNRFKKSQLSRISVNEPRAHELISAIRKKQYSKAISLVNQGVKVDGHTPNENTPLTDAAARGDQEGVNFILGSLKANPNASCHCPLHRTALHYAAEHGHPTVVQTLLKHGANPNALNSNNQTALDVTKKPDIEKLLIESGGKKQEQLIAIPVNHTRRL